MLGDMTVHAFLENTVDLDQVASPSDQDLHCFLL